MRTLGRHQRKGHNRLCAVLLALHVRGELPDAHYYFDVSAEDGAGNYNSVTNYFEVDTVVRKFVSGKPAGTRVSRYAWIKATFDDAVHNSKFFVNIYRKGSSTPLPSLGVKRTGALSNTTRGWNSSATPGTRSRSPPGSTTGRTTWRRPRPGTPRRSSSSGPRRTLRRVGAGASLRGAPTLQCVCKVTRFRHGKDHKTPSTRRK